MTLILGLETSCDETAASVVENGRVVRSNVVSTQHELHERYGGVVPELASRAHLEKLLPVVRASLDQAGVHTHEIDAIAVGNRPGLVGSLVVGTAAAKALAWSLGKPIIGVDHVLAHLFAPHLIEADESGESHATADHPGPLYPAIGLVVSGGHTSLYRVDAPGRASILGKTIDDAVGEAYDKAAVMLKAGYPGGPSVDALAQRGDGSSTRLPRPMLGAESLDFSFSGLKTALLYAVRGTPTGRGKSATFERDADDLTDQQRADLAASFQEAVGQTLISKIKRAHRAWTGQLPPRSLIIGGGVSANSLLRERVADLADRLELEVHLPAMAYCVDNAAMIAGYGYVRYQTGAFDDLSLPVVATTSIGFAD